MKTRSRLVKHQLGRLVVVLEWRDHLVSFELKEVPVTVSGCCLLGQNAYEETLDCQFHAVWNKNIFVFLIYKFLRLLQQLGLGKSEYVLFTIGYSF